MPRFMAVHTLPYGEKEFMEAAKQMSEKMSQIPPGVTYNLTYCGFDDHKYYCDWQAPNKETLEQVFKAMELPYDAISPVRIYDVSKMTLEP